MNNYHNTTKVEGGQLSLFEGKASRQADVILEMFHKRFKLTASEVFLQYPEKNTPITSIRRAITNLVRDGKLEKLDGEKAEFKIGMYGRREYVYQFLK